MNVHGTALSDGIFFTISTQQGSSCVNQTYSTPINLYRQHIGLKTGMCKIGEHELLSLAGLHNKSHQQILGIFRKLLNTVSTVALHAKCACSDDGTNDIHPAFIKKANQL